MDSGEEWRSDDWIEMSVSRLVVDPITESPVLLLRSKESKWLLPIWIALPEASSIALALDGVVTPRPLTHDLLRDCLRILEAKLERVEIWGLVEGTFHARLQLAGNADQIEVDARPSDAVALAVRMGSPIWVARTVLRAANLFETASEVEHEEDLRSWLEEARPEDLGKYKM